MTAGRKEERQDSLRQCFVCMDALGINLLR
ncbi:MAG: hypothetical protein M2R45_00324 [Verrucomicrobia subdivision 3 bacterium]|nr:hypothetical protein [Limisphaerales bacterium]MCS1412917.1 hypothetical protein [Limisphaerales bacterium]